MSYRQVIWFFIPTVFYLIPFLSSLNPILPLLGLIPVILVISLNIRKLFSNILIRDFYLLYFYIISSVLYSLRDGYTQGVIAYILLIIFLIVLIPQRSTSLHIVDYLSKYFFYGLIFLFVFIMFIPLILNFPFTIGSWYLVAANQLPLVRSTLDGPLIISCIVGGTLLISSSYKKMSITKVQCYFALSFLFYCLLVYNRRVSILLFLLLIPFVAYRLIYNSKINLVLFLIVFLVPLFFGTILIFANDILSIPSIKSITLRTNDLDPESNARLNGWVMALAAFENSSFTSDFFAFHEELIRSDDDRYNHFHNSFIQLFYEQGIFGFTVVLCLMFNLIRSIRKFTYSMLSEYTFVGYFPLILIVLIFFMPTESVFRRISLSNILFIISSFFIIKSSILLKNESL